MDQFRVTIVTKGIRPNRFWGSLLHGILCEALPAPLPDKMHEDAVRPVAQWVEPKDGSTFVWHINTIDDAFGNAIQMMLKEKQTLTCKKLQCEWNITDVQCKHTDMADYMKSIFLEPEPADGVVIHFHTTTTHKVDGRNACFPSIELMANSIRRKFSPLVPDFLLDDEEVLQQLLNHMYICNYQLQSGTYCLEKSYLTGYYGTCELHFSGPDPLRRIAEALFCFGNWTGIGAKTSLGMGGCTVTRWSKRKEIIK